MSYVRLTKCKNVADPASWSSCYTIEGRLTVAPQIGGHAVIEHRPGAGAPEFFRTGRILDYDEAAGYFMDESNVYHVQALSEQPGTSPGRQGNDELA